MKKQEWLKSVALGAAVVCLTAPQARAGFEWTPPPVTVPQREAVMPPPAAAPTTAVEAEALVDSNTAPSINPFPMQQDAMTPLEGEAPTEAIPPLVEPATAPAPVAAETVMPPATAVLPAMPVAAAAVAMPPPVPAPKAVYDTIDGFGSEIPLALAMGQIVPSNYSYAFDPDINMGTRISWNGGKPWNEVLEDALRPIDMRVMIEGNTVRVRQTWDIAEQKMMDTASAAKPLPMAAMMPSAPVPVAPPPVDMPVGQVAVPTPALAAAQPQGVDVPQSYPHRQRPDLVPGRDAPAVPPQEDIVFSTSGPAAASPFAPTPPAPATAPATVSGPQPIPLTPSGVPMPAMASAPLTPPPPKMMGMGMPAGMMDMQIAGSMPVMDPMDIKYWQAEQGMSLRDVLTRWSESAAVAILWNSPYDYVLAAPVHMHGTFPDAVTQILMTYNALDPRPVGQLHPNLPNGPSVLVIENYSSATN